VPAPDHADAMLFMEYYKLWDTPLDGEAWTLFRTLQSEGALQDFARFSERVPRSSHAYVLFGYSGRSTGSARCAECDVECAAVI
jgi:hypothetical protein